MKAICQGCRLSEAESENGQCSKIFHVVIGTSVKIFTTITTLFFSLVYICIFVIIINFGQAMCVRIWWCSKCQTFTDSLMAI